MRYRSSVPVCAAFCVILSQTAVADDGLWPWNQIPKDSLKTKNSFEATDAFLDNLRLASLKIGDSGSASFASPAGLLVTSHSVISGCLAKIGSAQHDYKADGFYAAERSAEIQCPGLQGDVLLSDEDITTQIKGPTKDLTVKDATPTAEVVKQRNAAIAKAEADCVAKTHNVCSVVRLFSGGRFDMLQYKRYSDLRLVFAPEYALAFFGRERDSISYLRYGLSIAFLRAYENGAPAATPHYLKWNGNAVKEDDLLFAAGNPGPTSRVITSAQLTFLRDTALPLTLNRLNKRVAALSTMVAAGGPNQAAALAVLTGFLGEYKTTAGKLIGLRDDRLVLRKTNFDSKIKRAVEGNPKLGATAAKVWDDMTAAYKRWMPEERNWRVLEGDAAPGSELFRLARQLVRGETVDAEPVVNDAVEAAMLGQYFDELKLVNLGDKELPLKTFLTGKTSQESAETLVKGSKLKDPAERARLAGNKEEVAKSDDPMIKLARMLETPAARLHKDHEDVIGSLEASAAEKIAQYRFKLFGAADYPDGTLTPRFTYGSLKTYTDRAGTPQPIGATFSGLYYRRNNDGPYQVPQKWVDAKDTLDPVAALNLVSTVDIGGGDYGSPVVNRSGELVGVTFDGNLESLPVVYLYTDETARAVHVAAQGIVEALTKVYKADALLKEINATVSPVAGP